MLVKGHAHLWKISVPPLVMSGSPKYRCVTLAQLLVLPKHQFPQIQVWKSCCCRWLFVEGAPGDSCTCDRRWKMGILNCGSALQIPSAFSEDHLWETSESLCPDALFYSRSTLSQTTGQAQGTRSQRPRSSLQSVTCWRESWQINGPPSTCQDNSWSFHCLPESPMGPNYTVIMNLLVPLFYLLLCLLLVFTLITSK